MGDDRHLEWDGCANVRDLGGLPARDGRPTRRGAIVRADAPDRLSSAGWAAARSHGIRTVIDLRNDDERGSPAEMRDDGLEVLHLPLDGVEDTEFWDVWGQSPAFGTPLYYRPFLDRFPERVAAVIGAVARARPGGVLVHCSIGRDRTGLVALVLLALAGVAPEDIAADHALSHDRVAGLLAELGRTEDAEEIEAFYAGEGTTPTAAILALLESVDFESYLVAAGLSREDLAAVRTRLAEP